MDSVNNIIAIIFPESFERTLETWTDDFKLLSIDETGSTLDDIGV
jgi:hypothetical protein